MSKTKYKTVDFSRTTITELMIPSHANFGGKVHGGMILSLMDKAAYACAAKHAGGYCVTVSMNAVDFLAPVEVGNLVHLHASVNHVGTSSIVVGIKVVSENINTGVCTHTNTSYLTMVAVDENKKPRKVPGLILSTKEEIRRFCEAKKRKELIAEYKEITNRTFESIDINSELGSLDEENCILANSIDER